MEFFEPPPPRETQKYEPPEWSRPPPRSLGGLVPWRFVLAEGGGARIVVRDVVAHGNGVELDLGIRFREPPEHQLFHRLARARHPLDDDFLRFGVELADGRKLTNLDDRQQDTPDAVLRWTGGSGGGSEYETHYWLWPLPPSGPLTFVCEWPAFGIPLTRAQVDAREALDAARRARILWADG